MEVKTKTVERASTTIPHDLFVRFLRSLGARVPEKVNLHVHQPSYTGTNADIHVHWDLSDNETSREVDMIDDDVIGVVAGLNATEDEKDIPF